MRDCPRCGTAMSQKAYEYVQVDQCSKCSGVFLDAGELEQIIEVKSERFSPEVLRETLEQSQKGLDKDKQKDSVPCPGCQDPMTQTNYHYESGILLDFCGGCLGSWLDGKELEKVQAYREDLDRLYEEKKSEWEALHAKVGGEIQKNDELDAGKAPGLVHLVYYRVLSKLGD